MNLRVSTSRDAEKVDQLPRHPLRESTNGFRTRKFPIKLISFTYEKFRLRRGHCFDVVLQAVTTHEMIFTSGLDSSKALSSSSTSELHKMSYKLHQNKKASEI